MPKNRQTGGEPHRAAAKGSAESSFAMVGVAQLVERRFVAPVVVGSIPIVHPNYQRPDGRNRDVRIRVCDFGPLAQLVEQWTLNPLVEGSNPSRPTIKSRGYLKR